MRGRIPKPTEHKRLTGTLRPSRANPAEPVVEIEAPPRPEHLSPEARQEWDRVLPILLDMRVLSPGDMATLATYAVAYGRWAAAERELSENGVVVKSPNGYPIQNPFLSVANTAIQQMERACVQLGLTPSARTRVHAKEKPAAMGVSARKRTTR
jgi:P27 family predicted phage terminase small subunit